MAISKKAVLADLKLLRRKPDGDIYKPDLNSFIKKIGQNHDLAHKLWLSGDHAARELALQLIDPAAMTERHLEHWVKDLNEWGLCDGFVARLVRPTSFAVIKAHEWAERQPEYQRRAGFALMAQLAWQKNAHKDAVFVDFLPLVEKHAADERYFVKKAVNWALRDIGKRNPKLARKALAVAARLQKHESATARWVGRHRMGEVTDAHSGD
jgi:3-methyladenine DNA glycosylase AlkD